ncbi:ZN395 protein, partial [Smithornis capensis]|nr:ZN395 protein [Smithornis capensis]
VSDMATVLSRRLGKRSLLGTRVSADGMLVAAQIPGLQPPHEDGSRVPAAEENSQAPRFPSPGLQQLHTGQQVLITYSGQECEQGQVLLPDPGCWRVQDTLQPPPLPEILQRSVSSSIDVPKSRKGDAAVDMDEMVAALVLTSLSCSPVVQSPPAGDSGLPQFQVLPDPCFLQAELPVSLSLSRCSSPFPSSIPFPGKPPAIPAAPSQRRDTPGSAPGVTPISEPSRGIGSTVQDSRPGEHRPNSVKVMYKCLWPSCGKVLRSIVGIKRHVRTQHLGDGADSEQRKREEDFYYTEVQVKEEAAPEAATSSTSPTSTSAPIIIQQTLAKPEPLLLEQPLLEPTLSQSAPSSFWHIQADHAYQALPSIQIPVSPHIFTSISWATATSTLPSLSPVRSRSLSFSEPQAPTPLLKSHL